MDEQVEKLISYLKLYGGKMAIGVGGKRKMDYYDDYYPGTGLRAPGAPLYGKPKSHRVSILRRAIEEGFIEAEGDLTSSDTIIRLTEKGKAFVVRCKCGKPMTPYLITAYVKSPRFSTVKKYRRWLCEVCDRDEIEEARREAGKAFMMVSGVAYSYTKLLLH
ncbi:hypothetical protein DRP07_02190 [Archaeoglobales archaeon]|nr:MAG: hypothetical protein DRP07_02190 [Archaeoglobales archaeon]